MNFLVDQMLPVWLANWISDHGDDAEHVRRIGLADAPDTSIRAEARRRNATIITKDSDFAQPPGPGVPVVWVRLRNVSKKGLAQTWPRAWPAVKAQLQAGEMLVELR